MTMIKYFDSFSTMYKISKEQSIKKRLEDNHHFTNDAIRNIFEKYNWDLEKIEDIIIDAENNNTIAA